MVIGMKWAFGAGPRDDQGAQVGRRAQCSIRPGTTTVNRIRRSLAAWAYEERGTALFRPSPSRSTALIEGNAASRHSCTVKAIYLLDIVTPPA
jgi:hypothetical protein